MGKAKVPETATEAWADLEKQASWIIIASNRLFEEARNAGDLATAAESLRTVLEAWKLATQARVELVRLGGAGK